jgi:hypothetical protein
VLSIFFEGCGEKPNTSSPAAKKRLTFEFSNQTSKGFGFKEFDDGSALSVTSICRDKDLVFITDAVHDNVKEITISTGKVKSSLP